MDLPARQQPSARQPKARLQTTSVAEPTAVGISAAVIAVQGEEPVVAVVPARREEPGGDGALPSGLFSPRQHDDLETALRSCVKHQTGLELASARQIGTLVGRHGADGEGPPQSVPVVAVCYLALLPPDRVADSASVDWRSWYAYFPWEDWRRGKPAYLTEQVEPRLQAWARLTPAHCEASAPPDRLDRRQRLRMAFGCDGGGLGRGEGAGALRASERGGHSRRRGCRRRRCCAPDRVANAALVAPHARRSRQGVGQRHRRGAAQRQIPAGDFRTDA